MKKGREGIGRVGGNDWKEERERRGRKMKIALSPEKG